MSDRDARIAQIVAHLQAEYARFETGWERVAARNPEMFDELMSLLTHAQQPDDRLPWDATTLSRLVRPNSGAVEAFAVRRGNKIVAWLSPETVEKAVKEEQAQ